MVPPSNFRQFAYLITVGDICFPFLGSFDCERTVADVSEEWAMELCYERNLDPMDQIGLVTNGGIVKGWVGYDMLESEKVMAECMEPITPDVILTSDTSLVEAVTAFSKTTHPFFCIMRGNQFIGWLSYKGLHKEPLRICLLAMLLNLERTLLEVASLSPQGSFMLLSEGRRKKAKKIYSDCQYNYDEQGKPYYSKLLECTTIVDKLTIARRFNNLIEAIPALRKTTFRRVIERLRNEIAHARLEERSSELLERKNLGPFIEWAEILETELQEYLTRS